MNAQTVHFKTANSLMNYLIDWYDGSKRKIGKEYTQNT